MSAVDGDARWHDAVTAVEVLSVDAAGVGGVLMRAWPGPVRDQLCDALKQVAAGPVLRLPIHVTEDRLLGGLSLAATLQAGRVVVERGVLSQANGGVVLVSMAERLDPTVAAHLCAALDQRQLSLERDGVAQVLECRIGLVALDEGLDDEGTTPSLADRLGLHLDLRELSARGLPAVRPDAARVLAARERFPATEVPDEVVTALCEAAEQLGVPSLRAPVLAAAVARAHAALHGRQLAGEEDAVFAARLVLGPRATRLPPAEPETEAEAPPEPEPEPPADDAPQPPEAQDDSSPPNEDDSPPSEAMLQELLSAAAQSALPQGVLELLAAGRGVRKGPRSAGRAGTLRASNAGGRPAGTRAAVPQPGDRLNLVETLRAAAPWQRLRRKANGTAKVVVTLDDLRITRFVQRSESVVIFCVDASGSAALQRLAEAKGAVEQVLGDCYVRRDHVALIAFRGEQASLLLPPTRSLVRVRRCLADLAGGGGTPLAAGLDAALELALDGRKRGRTPLVVLMTDGRGNVGHAGARGAAAQADATASARRLRAQGVRALFLDTSPRPRAQARALAVEMAATYLPLPHLNARVISTQVQSMTEKRG